MLFRPVLLLVTLVSQFVLLSAYPVSAGSPAHGAKGAAMATAFAAVADDPSAIAFNPAGIGFQDGYRFYMGGMAIVPKTEFKDPLGNVEETESEVFGAPHLYVTSEIPKYDIAVGFGVYSPFGIGGRTWSDQGSLRYLSTENLIATLEARPVVAWRPSPSLSLAFGVDFMWAYDFMEQMVDQSMVQATDGRIRFEGDGTGWGWNLGLLWKPSPKMSIGAAYRSGANVDIDGDMELEDIALALQPVFGGQNIKTGAQTSHDFPSITTLSIAWDPANSWTLTLEGEWVNWSTFDTQTIKIDNPVPMAGFNDISMDQDWDDSWLLKFGTEYRLNTRLALRGGYAYLTSPVPDETLTPANPDAPQHHFFFGAGLTFTKLTLDMFYSFAHYEDRNVSNDFLSGEYSSQSHTLGMSMGWKF